MTDGYALLRAIEANPDEDTPRLVYADWLDEHAATDADRARAELIRVQCELARTPPGERKAELAAREYELTKYRKGWDSAYPVRLPPGQSYVRGFLDLWIKGTDFVTHCEQLARVMPLHAVWIQRGARAAAPVAACPLLRHARNLCLRSGGFRVHALGRLLASPHLLNVRVLDLSYNNIGASGWEALAATALPSLRVLVLHSSAGKDRGLEVLTGAPWFANLVGLYVSNCGVSDAAVIRLAGLPAAANLRSLAVDDRTRSDVAARAILNSPHLSRLERLWFPDDLGKSARTALRARFKKNLNLMSYEYD